MTVNRLRSCQRVDRRQPAAYAARSLRPKRIERIRMIRLLLLAGITVPAFAEDAPWSTYRGNTRRTGNTDNVAGPAKPEVLWFAANRPSTYAASPVPMRGGHSVPGARRVQLAASSTAFRASPKDPKADQADVDQGPAAAQAADGQFAGHRRRQDRLRRRHASDRWRGSLLLPGRRRTICSGRCQCPASSFIWKARRASPTAASSSAAGRRA